jgi:hypothetical protein
MQIEKLNQSMADAIAAANAHIASTAPTPDTPAAGAASAADAAGASAEGSGGEVIISLPLTVHLNGTDTERRLEVREGEGNQLQEIARTFCIKHSVGLENVPKLTEALQAEWRDAQARKAGEALRLAEQGKAAEQQGQREEEARSEEEQFLALQRQRLMEAEPSVREARKALAIVRSGNGTDGLEVTASLRMLHKIVTNLQGAQPMGSPEWVKYTAINLHGAKARKLLVTNAGTVYLYWYCTLAVYSGTVYWYCTLPIYTEATVANAGGSCIDFLLAIGFLPPSFTTAGDAAGKQQQQQQQGSGDVTDWPLLQVCAVIMSYDGTLMLSGVVYTHAAGTIHSYYCSGK